MPYRRGRWYALLTVSALVATPALAVVEPQDSPFRAKEFRHDALHVRDDYSKASEVSAEDSPAVRNIASLGVLPAASYLDVRSGRWGALMPAEPLLPGAGVGNDLRWQNFAQNPPGSLAEHQQLAWETFLGYLQSRQDALLIDVGELASPGNVAVREEGALIQIHAPRVVGGVPVRDSFLTAILRHGNLILFGSRNWGDVRISAEPALSAAQAQAVARAHLAPLLDRGWRKSSLIFVPMSRASGAIGDGVDYRLAWALQPIFDGDLGRWEALVDAHSGELLAFEDRAHYASTRNVEGSVYPRSNDGIGPAGMEQPDFPMPFADVLNNGETLFADSGGNLLACVDGDVTTNLSGRFVRMSDQCGAIDETTSGDVLDLGFDPGTTDCAVPANAPSGSPGNTHASRTGFYELSRIIEMAQSHLPGNTWLPQQLTANMNINNTCNAFWDGSTVNFYRSGGGCFNTGELAGVFDHEWGHGMDDNDVNPTVSSPGEGIADIFAYMRLVDSCIGPGFRATNCTGFGDPCLDCTGVRDIDWAKRASGLPHDVAWADPNCGSGGGTPCGGITHCEGALYAEAYFDLVNRDLATLFGMDLNTALEVGARLGFLGSGPVGNWFQCIIGFGGCNADGGYLNFIAADDDNGDLSDGTPHMSAIFAAFDRHGIACGTPVVADSGCADRPVTAPTVVATPQDRGVNLTWDDVGADHYKIYRTDGVLACDFGKTIVGQTTGTSFNDKGLKNEHDYSYVVIPFGSEDSCFGPSSDCVPVAASDGANLSVAAAASELVLLVGGDGDVFLDNCEQGKFTVPLFNVGTTNLTGVKIVDVVPLSHPTMTVLTPLPRVVDNNLMPCEENAPMIKFQADGLAAGEAVEFRVDVMSDQLGTQSQIVRLTDLTEGDLIFAATHTFSFEADRDGWSVVSGTFDQVAGAGGNGSSGFLASSSNTPNTCDNVRSPILSLQSDSTMTVWTNFNIEGFCAACAPPQWYDRANIGIFDVEDVQRTVVSPSSGRTYNASGNSATTFCTNEQPGWADNQLTWATSDFTAVDLDAGNIAGRLVQLDVAYGTDPAFNPEGLRFDEVTVTNVSLQAADAQGDACPFVGAIFLDGFESGDVSSW